MILSRGSVLMVSILHANERVFTCGEIDLGYIPYHGVQQSYALDTTGASHHSTKSLASHLHANERLSLFSARPFGVDDYAVHWRPFSAWSLTTGDFVSSTCSGHIHNNTTIQHVDLEQRSWSLRNRS